MLEMLEAWSASGSSRLDRDENGTMDVGAAPAVMDAFYPRLLDAVLAPALGPQVAELKRLEGQSNFAGSGFTGGGINYVEKDLRTVLGERLAEPFDTRFCGAEDLAACRDSVWAALDAAGAEIATRQGEDPEAWTSDANAERIRFAPGLLPTSIRYTNRPSGIQQVISFGGHRARRR